MVGNMGERLRLPVWPVTTSVDIDQSYLSHIKYR